MERRMKDGEQGNLDEWEKGRERERERHRTHVVLFSLRMHAGQGI